MIMMSLYNDNKLQYDCWETMYNIGQFQRAIQITVHVL